MIENTIKCELCGLICSMQISATHLRAKHSMTTKEYRALGYKTLSQARLEQLRQSPVGSGGHEGVRRLYGSDHPNWKGGYINGAGYHIVSRRGKKALYAHRVIAEEMLGRPLKSNEVVHHKDGNRSNNSPDNLVIMMRQEHDKMKQGTKRRFHITKETEMAARDLRSIGWSINKIGMALRVEHRTVLSWLDISD